MSRLPPFLVVFGPTASGKSSLARALHERLLRGKLSPYPSGLELISADSMQVYRGMDIGTAKPSCRERNQFPHHLIDVKNPDEPFTAGDFVELAERAIRAASSRGALPLVSGGAAFYLRCLLCGMPQTPRSDEGVREEVQRDLVVYGGSSLRRELERVDPESAARIAPADEYRLVRALEVYRLTGKPRSSFAAPVVLRSDALDAVAIGLSWPRAPLYGRINARVEDMARAGLREETMSLLRNGYRPGDPGLRAIGYREYLEAAGETIDLKNPSELASDEQVVPRIQRNTRRYAKRQITFFRAFEQARWIDGQYPEEAIDPVIEELAERFAG